MRLTAPAISGAAAVLAVALVRYFQPGGESPGVDGGAAPVQRELASEPVDAAWAPGAEADLFAEFAQIPRLALIESVAYSGARDSLPRRQSRFNRTTPTDIHREGLSSHRGRITL